MSKAKTLSPEMFAFAESIVNSSPVSCVYAACEWDELNSDGKTWVAAIVAETLRRRFPPQWFYLDGYSSEDCHDSPDEAIESMELDTGAHIVQIDCAGPLPSIWCSVEIRTDEQMDALGTDDREVIVEHATKEDAEAYLAQRSELPDA